MAILAGFSLSISHAWSKHPIIATDSERMGLESKKIASLGLSLVGLTAITGILSPVFVASVGSLIPQLLWIAVLSLIAKAALSIAFEDSDQDYCRIMCLIGIVYCYLIDQALFMESFKPE